MNIKIQCCGIALMLVILYFYSRQRKMQIHTERVFLGVFWTTLISVVLDVLSLVAIEYRTALGDIMVDIVCKSYVASVVWVTFSSLLYVSTDFWNGISGYKKKVGLYTGVALCGTILVFLFPIEYVYEDGRFLHTDGMGILIAYIFGVAFMLTAIRWLVKEKAYVSKRRKQAVGFWMFIWVAATIVQFMMPSVLIVGYASCVGVMVLYLKLENPESNLDRQSGMFNHSALMQHMQQFFAKGKSFTLLSIMFERALYQAPGSNMGQVASQKLVDFVQHLHNVKAFKNAEDEIILVFANPAEAEKTIALLYKRFEDTWGKNNFMIRNTNWAYIPDSSIVGSAEDIMYLLKYASQKAQEYGAKEFMCIDESVVSKMYEERRVEKLLRDAIEKNRVEVYYQPIYSTKEHQFISAEALVRIRDEAGKIVPPGVFIDIAEKNGMILKLGEIVFEKVCSFITEYNPIQYGIHYIEVNLSVVQCAYEYLAEAYISIMKRYNVNPKYINLEITESASLNAKKTLLDNMKILMDYGVKFSLDDFGTGQSNLNYIVDMPVEIVKFDRQMSNAYFENGKARYVMDAAMHMIHGMQLEIVSEGIETEEQYQTMESLGISYIQGYYFSKPLPQGEFLEFIRQRGTYQLEMKSW